MRVNAEVFAGLCHLRTPKLIAEVGGAEGVVLHSFARLKKFKSRLYNFELSRPFCKGWFEEVPRHNVYEPGIAQEGQEI